MEAGKRVVQLGSRYAGGWNRLQRSRDSVTSAHGLDYSQLVKPTGKRVNLDTLALAKSLERCGMPLEHSEAITFAMNEALEGILKHISQTFLSKDETQIMEIRQEVNIFKLKLELQNSQDRHFEKFRDDIEKMRGQLCELRAHHETARYNIIKYCLGTLIPVSAGIAAICMFATGQ